MEMNGNTDFNSLSFSALSVDQRLLHGSPLGTGSLFDALSPRVGPKQETHQIRDVVVYNSAFSNIYLICCNPQHRDFRNFHEFLTLDSMAH